MFCALLKYEKTMFCHNFKYIVTGNLYLNYFLPFSSKLVNSMFATQKINIFVKMKLRYLKQFLISFI